MTSTASTTSMASMASTASFHQWHYWLRWLDHPWHQNNQYWSLFVEWIIKTPIFHWYYLALFLSEAVEASRCHFFENWWMKLKCPLLLKPLATIVQENSQSFYLSEPFGIYHFTMRHPVIGEKCLISINLKICSTNTMHIFLKVMV